MNLESLKEFIYRKFINFEKNKKIISDKFKRH